MEVVAIMALLPDLPVIGPAVAPRAFAQFIPKDVVFLNPDGPVEHVLTEVIIPPYGPIDIVIPPPDPDIVVIDTACRPIAGQIIRKLCTYMIPPGSLEVFINATPPHKALQLFEADTVAAYLKMHHISPADAPLVYQYGDVEMRSEIRTQMMSRIRNMTEGRPDSTIERSVYDWFKYQMWLFERTMYEVAAAERSAWLSNPCTWTPDSDLAREFGLKYDGRKFCNSNNSLSGLIGDPPIVPSKSYFLAVAQKKVYGKSLEIMDGGADALGRLILTSGVGAGFSAVVGGGVGAGIGLGAKTIWSAAKFGQTLHKGGSIVKLSQWLKVGIPGPTMIVTLMIQAGIEMGFRVFEYESVTKELKTLDDDLAQIRAVAPELSRYSGDNGTFKMQQAWAALTLPDVVGTAPLPSHNSLTDPAFYLTPSNTYSDVLTYQDDLGATFAATTAKGWFLRQCLTNCANLPATSITPSIDIVNPSGTAWTVKRVANLFVVIKKYPEADDVLCQSLNAAANPGKCASYVTQTVPYLNAAGNAGNFSLVTPPSFISGTTAYFTQGVAGALPISATSHPLPTISAVSALPPGFTVTPGTGTAALSYNGSLSTPAGTHSVTFVATNAFTTSQTVTIKVNAAPPQFTSPDVARFTKGVPGSFTIRATGNPAPVLTVGTPHFPPLELGLDFVDNGNGTATISGTVPINSPGCGGSMCTGLINATASGQAQTQQSLTLDVQSAVLPFLVPTPLRFTAGIESETKIVATGSTLGKISNVCNALPAWLTFTDHGNNTATVKANPPVGAPSVGLLVIVSPPGVPVQYNCGPGSGSNYTVSVINKPVITTPNKTSFTAGIAGVFMVVGGGPLDPVTMSGTLPAGLSFIPGLNLGVLNGTPAANSGGVYPLVFTSGSGANAAKQDFTLTVKERPAFFAPFDSTFTVNQPSSFPLTLSGYPQTPLADNVGMRVTLSNGTLPPGISLVEALGSLGQSTGRWLLTGTPTATGPYTFLLAANNGLNALQGQQFTINVVPVPPVVKTTPVVTWTSPASITYGSALSVVQLNATASVAGTFTYAPPAGTVLPVGSHTLSVTFMPTDSGNYNSAAATTNITVNPAPAVAAGKPNLVLTNSLARIDLLPGVTLPIIVVRVRVANTGNALAAGVILSLVKVGSFVGLPLPQHLGIIQPGASIETVFQATGPFGAKGTASSLSITGIYTGGTIASNARITLP
jgi:hypothetical protein